MTRIGISLVQLKTKMLKKDNLAQVSKFVSKAALVSKIVVLPECFNAPYGTRYFKDYAEPANGETATLMQELSLKHSIVLLGSFIERDGSMHYNTCPVYENGILLGTHRKAHLFDIDIPGKITFKESDVLSAGNQITTVSTSYGLIGVGICYDLRFPGIICFNKRIIYDICKEGVYCHDISRCIQHNYWSSSLEPLAESTRR